MVWLKYLEKVGGEVEVLELAEETQEACGEEGELVGAEAQVADLFGVGVEGQLIGGCHGYGAVRAEGAAGRGGLSLAQKALAGEGTQTFSS